jgi:putative glutathione S-transferase
MGYLQRGTWVDQWYDTASTGGRFVRQDLVRIETIHPRRDAITCMFHGLVRGRVGR